MHSGQQQTWLLGHRPALDGVRAVAVLAVLAHHAWLLPAGYVGVDVFFALSGFLITSLLLEEYADRGRIRLGAFYRRRALRLVPALALLVTAVMAIGMVAQMGPRWVTGTSAAAALLYVTNFALLDGHYSVLTHTWSLAIEEQFYLTWPLLLVAIVGRGRRVVLWTAGGLAVVGAVWSRVVFLTGSREHYAFGLDSRVAVILAGCALAAWMHQRPPRRVPVMVPVAAWSALAALAVFPGLLAGWRIGALAVVSVTVVWSVAQAEHVRLLGLPALRWVGVRSYGIYLWHVPVIVLFEAMVPGASVPVVGVVALAATLVVAHLSYVFVEERFLRRKRPERVGVSR